MSGKPNTDGIKKLHQALKDFAYTRTTISDLQRSIEERQKSLELRQTELNGLYALIKALQAEMDVASPANNGWEQRHFEMLLMLSQVYN